MRGYEPGRPRRVLIGAVLALGACGARAAAHARPEGWIPALFPSPFRSAERCGRQGYQGDSLVCDPDGVLGVEEANKVDDLLSDIARAEPPFGSTPCAIAASRFGGFQVGVALASRLASQHGRPIAKAAPKLAEVLYFKWGLDSACKDSALLVLSVQDAEAAVYLGERATPLLRREVRQRLLRRARRRLKAGKVAEAVEGLAEGLALGLLGRPEPWDAALGLDPLLPGAGLGLWGPATSLAGVALLAAGLARGRALWRQRQRPHGTQPSSPPFRPPATPKQGH